MNWCYTRLGRLRSVFQTSRVHPTIPRVLRQRSLSTQSPEVRILEVAPRDGLQNVKTVVPTEIKVELINRLADSGLKNIEATSFVPAKWVPQLHDGAEVMRQIQGLNAQGVDLPVLTPNLKGLETAIKSRAEHVVVFASATEAFSKANQNCTVEEALAGASKVAEAALQNGLRVRGVISCIFSDPYSSSTDPMAVVRIAKRFLDMGCYEVGLGDTVGVGTPYQTQKLLEYLLRDIPADKLAGHFHDTYGQGVANVIAAYSMGIRTFDSSTAGLGGCPYAPGAKGNVSTEDVVYALENSGIATGIDLDKLSVVGDWISKQIGVSNSSRAGAALMSKRRQSITPAASTDVAQKSKREWKTIRETNEYRVDRAGPTVKITLTRSHRGNTMTLPMLKGLTQVFKDLASDQTAFHVVLAADGKYFCTGMDLSGGTNTTDTDLDEGYHAVINDLFAAIDNSPQTTIAVMDGPAYGGGVGLGFVCDVRLASPRASWRLSEIKIGVSPAIISRYLAREWGFSVAREAILSGRQIDPSELQRIGAIHGLSDNVEALLDKYLDGLANCAPRSASNCKKLMRTAWRDPGGQSQDSLIQDLFHHMMAPGSEGEHGLREFKKKNRNIQWADF